jgi:hypothetical protein
MASAAPLPVVDEKAMLQRAVAASYQALLAQHGAAAMREAWAEARLKCWAQAGTVVGALEGLNHCNYIVVETFAQAPRVGCRPYDHQLLPEGLQGGVHRFVACE